MFAARRQASAEFAGVYDGDSLWLAVSDAPEGATLGVRVEGRVYPLVSDLVDAPGLQTRTLLSDAGLPEGAWRGQLVADGDAIASPPLVESVTRAPASRRGPWRWEVQRTDDGLLELTRTPAPGQPLTAVAQVHDGMEFHLDADALVLLGRDDTEVARIPVVDGVATIRAPDVPIPAGAMARFFTADRVPVVRARNALAKPTMAVVLPVIWIDTEEGRASLRHVYTPEGQAAIRRTKPEPAQHDEETS